MMLTQLFYTQDITMFKKIIFTSLIVLSAFSINACSKRENTSTFDLPSKSNLENWSKMLNPIIATDDTALLTTPKPSNVSPSIAITKMLQALNSYDGNSSFPLNTVFTINRVNEVIINKHKYYVGLCEFDFKKTNGNDISSLDGQSSCLGLVDAENINAPAMIRTANAEGKPYKFKIHQESLTVGRLDSNQIRRYLDDNGFENLRTLTKEISKPNIELDNDYNVYYTASWLYDDGAGVYGTAYYPLAFLMIDISSGEIKSFAMDNPLTPENEGEIISDNIKYKFSEIPKWVDWVFSKRMFIQNVTFYGYNIDNYGKKGYLGQLILDGTHVNDDVEVMEFNQQNSKSDIINTAITSSKSLEGNDLILTGFLTSNSNDMSVNKIVQMNARTGKTVIYDRTGSKRGMTVQSSVREMVENANLMRGAYKVEDITLNPIFGKYTWQMVITRNMHDNEGNDITITGDSNTFYSESDISYAIYSQTCLLEATNDIKISDIVCSKDNDTVYILYRDFLYRKSPTDSKSTTLEDKDIVGVVSQKIIFNDQVIIKLDNIKRTFIVTVDNLFDKNVGDAVSIMVGDSVNIKYGEQPNSLKSPVRYIKQI